MSKRAAEASDEQSAALKAGERPMIDAPADEVGEFEDEFEDEFESEDEILEAGVDGRPDAEREEEERGWSSLRNIFFFACNGQYETNYHYGITQRLWMLTSRLSFLDGRNWRQERPCRLIPRPTTCCTP